MKSSAKNPQPSQSERAIDSPQANLRTNDFDEVQKTIHEALATIAEYKKTYQAIGEALQAQYLEDLSPRMARQYLTKLKEIDPAGYATLKEYTKSLEEQLHYDSQLFSEEEPSATTQLKKQRAKMIKKKRNWISMR